MDALLEPFRNGIGQRALVEILLLASVCGPLGVWVVLYRSSYAAESLAHGLLPGLVVAALAGLPLLLGAVGGVLVAAALVALAGRDARIGADTGVAVAVTGLFGLGALLALVPASPPRLQELLFGDPLGVTGTDIALTAGLAVAVVVALARWHRPLALAALDPLSAPSHGAPPARMALVVLCLLGITVAFAVQALGALLVVALVLGPAATALVAARRLPAILITAAALGMIAAVLGLSVSHHLELAAGASVALAAVLPLVLARAAVGR